MSFSPSCFQMSNQVKSHNCEEERKEGNLISPSPSTAGSATSPSLGHLVSINTKLKTAKEAGLPKKAVESCVVTVLGVGDDYNHYRTTRKKADPDMAVSLITCDVI